MPGKLLNPNSPNAISGDALVGFSDGGSDYSLRALFDTRETVSQRINVTQNGTITLSHADWRNRVILLWLFLFDLSDAAWDTDDDDLPTFATSSPFNGEGFIVPPAFGGNWVIQQQSLGGGWIDIRVDGADDGKLRLIATSITTPLQVIVKAHRSFPMTDASQTL